MSSSERADREPAEADSAAEFELSLSVPYDMRLAVTVRALAVCAAQQVGCADAAAASFGHRVEDAVHSSLQDGASGHLPVIVRHRARSLEVIINGRTLMLDA